MNSCVLNSLLHLGYSEEGKNDGHATLHLSAYAFYVFPLGQQWKRGLLGFVTFINATFECQT